MYDKSTDPSVRNDKKNLLCFELENSPHFSKTPDCHIRESNINVLSPLEFSCYDTFLKSVTLRGNAYVKLVSSNRIKASLSIWIVLIYLTVEPVWHLFFFGTRYIPPISHRTVLVNVNDILRWIKLRSRLIKWHIWNTWILTIEQCQ